MRNAEVRSIIYFIYDPIGTKLVAPLALVHTVDNCFASVNESRRLPTAHCQHSAILNVTVQVLLTIEPLGLA